MYFILSKWDFYFTMIMIFKKFVSTCYCNLRKYHIYLTAEERRAVINSLIDLRNDLISRGKYTDIIDELIIKFTKAKVKKIRIKEA